ncbi:MAG: hypothetical protein HY303_07225 [Candidatus Wallbacteria bacterium]|nr:hypothetical protein [Candidatus Wallbacteria bacterium]
MKRQVVASMAARAIRALAAFFALAAAAGAVWASPPKHTAPVDVRLDVLGSVQAGKPVKLRLQAVPRVDAPQLRLAWLLPQGVLAQSGPSTWSGPVTAGQTAELTVTVLLADLTPRTVLAGATILWPDGSRQVRSASLDLPPGSRSKADPNPPVTRNSRGEPILEHVVPAAPAH